MISEAVANRSREKVIILCYIRSDLELKQKRMYGQVNTNAQNVESLRTITYTE